jgi:hypothetical protein
MTELDVDSIRRNLERAFRPRWAGEPVAVYRRKRQDFAFHMTDWIDDLELLIKAYQSPTRFRRSEWEGVINGFVVHVAGHLVEAARAYDDEWRSQFDSSPLVKARQGSSPPPSKPKKARQPRSRRRGTAPKSAARVVRPGRVGE